MKNIPDNYRIVLTGEQIQARVGEMGAEISRYCEDGDRFCVKVEYPSDQVVGLEDGESYGIQERIYREPTATFGPDPSEVLPPSLISSRESEAAE